MLLEDGVVEEVFPLEELEVLGAVVLLEVGLAVDILVVGAEESPDERCLGLGSLEEVLLHLLEFRNHLFVNHEVLGSVLSFVAEGLTLAQATEGQESGHAEGGVDQDARYAVQLLGIHGTHRGGHD